MDNNPTQSTRQCPYCGEDIQPEAIKCKHCNEWLVSNPPPRPKTPEELEKEEQEKKNEKFGKIFAGGFLLVYLLGPVILIAILGLIATWTVPDLNQHRENIHEKAISCAKDQAGDILGLLGGSILKPLVSMAMDTEAAQKALIEQFDQLNKIEYVPGTFWSQARIVNRIHPEGKTISFGILGMVFPSLSWADMAILDNNENTNTSGGSSSSPSSTQQESPTSEDSAQTAPSADASHQTYHGQIQGSIRCEFDLYFEPANDYGQQEVKGTYSYTSQGSRPIILRGWYNPQTDEMALTEYYDDGRANCSMRVSRTPDGFKGWFIRPNKDDLTLVMTE